MRKSKWIVTTILFVILISLCICVYAENLTDLQQESSEIVEELNEKNNKLQAIQEQISVEMQQLQELDTQITQSQDELNNINIKIDELSNEIEENETKLEKIEKEFNEMQDLLDARVIAVYEAPKLQFLDIMLSSNNFSDFLANYYAMKELLEYDTELLNKVKTQKKEMEETKEKLASEKQEIISSKQTEQKKSQVLSNTKKAREYYISKLSTEEKELQKQIDEYNFQVAEIEAEIKMLALNSISSDYIGGVMQWPVPGYTTLTSEYGMRVHPITGAYKLHTGIDIGAPMGTRFVAAANGVVSKATFNVAYGNMVIIDHGGGVQTLYAHGSEILVQIGQVVSSGTEILRVGSTGYSTGPHAHFEIRIDGQTINPIDYLLKDNKVEDLEKKEG